MKKIVVVAFLILIFDFLKTLSMTMFLVHDQYYINYEDFMVLDSPDLLWSSEDDEVIKKSPKFEPVMPKIVGFEDP